MPSMESNQTPTGSPTDIPIYQYHMYLPARSPCLPKTPRHENTTSQAAYPPVNLGVVVISPLSHTQHPVSNTPYLSPTHPLPFQ